VVPTLAQAVATFCYVRSCEALDRQLTNSCCIYSGEYFIEVGHLRGAIAQIFEIGSGYYYPVTGFPVAIQRALKYSSSGLIAPFYSQFEPNRPHDLDANPYDLGQLYWGTKQLRLNNNRIHSNGVGFEIPSWRFFAMDTPVDWERAERLAVRLRVQRLP